MVWKKIPGDCNLENSEEICKEANRHNKIVEWKENKQSLMTFLYTSNNNRLGDIMTKDISFIVVTTNKNEFKWSFCETCPNLMIELYWML